jgi:peptide-methionine (S)-S-oxide reductase
MTGLLKRFSGPLAIAVVGAGVAGGLFWNGGAAVSAEEAVEIPAPELDPADASGALQTAVLAGGCFWGVQAVFQHTDGVVNAVSGYAGGTVENPSYEQVTTGTTKHAEAVAIRYDPKKISYGKLLQIFFSVAHDPTTLNRQGPDSGTQYRSAIYTHDDAQGEVAEAAKAAAQEVWQGRIVTEIAPLKEFYPAEDYHQEYFRSNPYQPYCQVIIAPKVAKLRKEHLAMLKK